MIDTVGSRSQPLVAVICQVPLLGEALNAALEGVASVRRFPAGGGDTVGLLRALRPDAVVVDSDDEAHEAAMFAGESSSPVLHVSLRDRSLRSLEGGRWRQAGQDASPEAIRNAVIGGIFKRETVT